MTKTERIQAVLSRRPVDRVPVSFWRHAPEVDHIRARPSREPCSTSTAAGISTSSRAMSSGMYCVEDWGCQVAYLGSPIGAEQCTQHAVQSLGDWARIKPLDPGAGALGRELEAIRLIRQGRSDDAPILHTVFSR